MKKTIFSLCCIIAIRYDSIVCLRFDKVVSTHTKCN